MIEMKMQKISRFAFILFFTFVSALVLSSMVMAATSALRATFKGSGGTIETLTGTWKKSYYIAPVPFDLSKFTTKAIGMSGNLRQVTIGEKSKVYGSITLFAKGYDSEVGTAKYLDSSTSSNVRLNVFATFNPNKSACSDFGSGRIVCTTAVSKVYLYIPSHEDLKFFDEHPKKFTIEIVNGKAASVYAGNNEAGNDILKITDIGLTSFSFR